MTSNLDFLISGPINNNRVRELHSFLQEGPLDLLNVIINSQGGDEHCGRAIAGILLRLRHLGVKVITTGIGDVQSAAVIIFAAGEERQLSRLASVMVHESEMDVTGNSSKIKKTAKQMEADEKFWCDHLGAMTGTDPKIWLKLHNEETYLTPEEALKLNLATELI